MNNQTRVLQEIENLVVQLLVSMGEHKEPVIQLVDRSDYLMKKKSTTNMCRLESVRKFACLSKLLCIIQQLLLSNKRVTKRDIYYTHTTLFESQRTVDALVDDLASTFRVERHSLHISATCKGMVAGDLRFKENDVFVDCSLYGNTGKLISPFVDTICDLQSTSRFVLVVEKDALFVQLLQDQYHLKNNCIIMTGKGYPDLATRLLLRKLTMELQLASFLVTDADPFGIEIAHVYQFGSQSMSHQREQLAVPTLDWIGLSLMDLSQQFTLPKECYIPLTERDRKKGQEMLDKHGKGWMCLCDQLHRELVAILECNKKVEVEALCSLGMNAFSSLFLPQKIGAIISKLKKNIN